MHTVIQIITGIKRTLGMHGFGQGGIIESGGFLNKIASIFLSYRHKTLFVFLSTLNLILSLKLQEWCQNTSIYYLLKNNLLK